LLPLSLGDLGLWLGRRLGRRGSNGGDGHGQRRRGRAVFGVVVIASRHRVGRARLAAVAVKRFLILLAELADIKIIHGCVCVKVD